MKTLRTKIERAMKIFITGVIIEIIAIWGKIFVSADTLYNEDIFNYSFIAIILGFILILISLILIVIAISSALKQ